MATRSRIHHYVPQHLISNFAGNEKGQVCVFDKQDERTFWTNPKNICAESGFNEFQFDDMIISFEDAVSNFEALYVPVLRDIVEKRSILHLDEDRLLILRLFLAFQFLRTKFIRSQATELHEALLAKFTRMGIDAANVAGLQEPNQEEDKRQYLQFLFEETRSFALMLEGRDLFLQTAPEGYPFILGDHPVVLHNDRKFGPYGNIGWAVSGIQIYVPLSPSLALACWCETNINRAIKDRNELCQLVLATMMTQRMSLAEALRSNGIPEDIYHEKLRRLNSVCSGIRTHKFLEGDRNSTDLINSHQVAYSNRYLISSTDGFELAKKMISDNKKYKTSHKPVVQ